jgi:predicted metalloprotease
MRWQRGRRSSNVEDRRGMARGGMPMRAGGIGGLGLIAVLLISLFLGVDPGTFLGGGGPVQVGFDERSTGSAAPVDASPEEERLRQFVAVVLADTEDTWGDLFAQAGAQYREPALVLFRDQVSSGCGFASAQVGPFYCPADEKVYLDLGFFAELERRFGAPGDFAQAYVIAHEVGHHVQNLVGIAREVAALRQRADPATSNRLSVMMELQADCLAGMWAHHAQRARQVLEEGDIEEGLRAAAAVGDDTMQRRGGGRVVPDAFTHGSAEQRMEWFLRGFRDGRMDACDTFNAQLG